MNDFRLIFWCGCESKRGVGRKYLEELFLIRNQGRGELREDCPQHQGLSIAFTPNLEFRELIEYIQRKDGSTIQVFQKNLCK